MPDHELLRGIGHGSFGEVWLARTIMGSYRAVKIVYRHAFDHPCPYEREFEGIRRFEPVSRRHESQLAVLHVGRNDEAGCFYYVMELADDAGSGKLEPESYVPRTLKYELQRRERLSVDECLRIGLSLTTALEHLHGHGLVHRDIKPSNIIFVEGIPKLADIGLVSTLDATISVSGTPGYIAPEGSGTPQADLYSLGKVLYEMSMGRNRSEFPRLPADFATLPERPRLLELNAVLVKAGHGDPAHRYQTAAEMHADLALIRGGRSVKRLRRMEHHLVLAKRVAAVVIAVSVLVAGAWWQTWRAQRVANQHLTRLHAKEGTHEMLKGNYTAALPWLVGAFQLDPHATRNDALHRRRLATVLQQCPRPTGVFSWPDARVLYTDISTDGKWLATAHEDDQVRVWDREAGRLLRTLPHSFPVHFCRFLPPDNRLLTATFDQRCSLWDLAAEPVNALTWPHDLQTMAVQGYEFGFNRRTHQAYLCKWPYKVARYHPFTNRLEQLTLRLSVRAEGESVRLRILARDRAPDGAVWIADEFLDTPDLDRFVAARETSDPAPPRGRAWLILSGRPAEGDEEKGWQLVWDNVQVIEYPNGQPTLRTPRLLEQFNDAASPDWLFYSEPPRAEGRVENGQLVLTKSGAPPSGAWLIAIHRRPLEIRSGHTLEIEVELVASSGSPGLVGLALGKPAFLHAGTWDPLPSGDGRRLALASPDGTVRLRNLAPDRSSRLPTQTDERGLELRHPWRVGSADFSADARFLATAGGPSGGVIVWDVRDGERVPLDLPEASGITTCRFSPDGRFLALVGTRGLRLVRVGAWHWTASPIEGRTVADVTFSPLGQRMAVPEGRSLLIWDSSDLTRAAVRIATESVVARMGFSPDGQFLAASLENGSTRVWKVTTGEVFGPPLLGTLGRFGADGSELLLIGPGSGAWLWDLGGMLCEAVSVRPIAVRESVASLPDHGIRVSLEGDLATVTGPGLPTGAPAHPFPLRRASFTADGRFLITETSDSRSWIWDLATGTLGSPPRPTHYDPTAGEHPEITLPSEPRDPLVVSRLAAVLSGHQFDGKGGLDPVAPPERERLWRELREQQPAGFAVDHEQRRRWHGQLATRAEREWEWDAAVFHWEQVLGVGSRSRDEALPQPPGSSIERPGVQTRLAYAHLAAQEQLAAIARGRPRRSVIPPRPSWAGPDMLDLSAFYTQALREDAVPAERENSFGRLGGGIQVLGGVGFDLRGLIQLDGTNRTAIPLNRPCRKVHFLHAASCEVYFAVSAIYEVHYTSGQTARVELLNPVDLPAYRTSDYLRDAIVGSLKTSPTLATTIGWAGTNAEVESRHETLFLTRTTWELPPAHHDEPVAFLELRPGESRATPWVFAITVE